MDDDRVMDNVVLSPQPDGARIESPQAMLDCGGMDFIGSLGPAKMRQISELTEQATLPCGSPA